jgi:type IV secretory pathway TrbD component
MTTATQRLTGRGWEATYRPLRPATLLGQALVLLFAEAGLLRVYGAYDSSFHWAAHFLVAVIVTMAWLATYLLLTARPARGQVLLVLPVHLFAMFPDLLYRGAQVPHAGWSNLFLLHIQVHYLPGGDRSWVCLAALAVAAYSLVLFRWVAARTQEVADGLVTGVGIGGAAIWRAQKDPAANQLGHRHLGDRSGQPWVMLLHDLEETGAAFVPLAQRLAATHSALVPDLLGFGSSHGLGTRFGLDEQVAALRRLLDHVDARDVCVVGRGYGALVASALSANDSRVVDVLLLDPPDYASETAAIEALSSRSWLARHAVHGDGSATVACGAMCLLRPVGRRLAKALTGRAIDLQEHTFPAYRAALRALLNPVEVREILASCCAAVAVVKDESEIMARLGR